MLVAGLCHTARAAVNVEASRILILSWWLDTVVPKAPLDPGRSVSRRLLLLRHAKSSWGDPALPDHERPLAPRGRKAARRISLYLRDAGLRPDLALCSPTRRTRETLELLSPAFDRAEVLVEDGLYGGNENELLERLREAPESAYTVALIGHNPGMQNLASALAGPDPGAEAARLRERFPTGALAAFEIVGAWRELGSGSARLVSFIVPRELG